MPYEWSQTTDDASQTLRLWPHESLPPKGMAAFVLSTFTLILIPTLPLLGTVLLWGLLPFLLLAVWGIYFALQRNHKSRQVLEVLTLTDTEADLRRTDPNGQEHVWVCNKYWVQVQTYKTGGPVPNYITLKGNGREVEIGSFLSEEERIALYDGLCHMVRPAP